MNNNKTRPHNTKEQVSLDTAYDYIVNGDTTFHYRELEDRLMKWFETIGNNDLGNPRYAFRVDKEHKNGDELHVITDLGVIITFNWESKKAITVMFGRPAQLKRNFRNLKIVIPQDIQDMSRQYIAYKENGILINEF